MAIPYHRLWVGMTGYDDSDTPGWLPEHDRYQPALSIPPSCPVQYEPR